MLKNLLGWFGGKRQADIERVRGHLRSIPVGWEVTVEWSRNLGKTPCYCIGQCKAILQQFVADWPASRDVDHVQVCAQCGGRMDEANDMIDAYIKRFMADKLGASKPPVPVGHTFPMASTDIQQLVQLQQAGLCEQGGFLGGGSR